MIVLLKVRYVYLRDYIGQEYPSGFHFPLSALSQLQFHQKNLFGWKINTKKKMFRLKSLVKDRHNINSEIENLTDLAYDFMSSQKSLAQI